MSYRQVEYRVVLEHDNVLYYPKILAAQVSDYFPLQVPTARIEIETNTASSTSGYTSPARTDDIVRLQVNETTTPTEKSKWVDLFEGRIMSISSQLDGGNNTFLYCRGHAEELLYRQVTADYTKSSGRTGTIISELIGDYLDRIIDGSPSLLDTTNSTVLTSFNVDQDTKYLIDIVKELEDIEGNNYIFTVVPQYDSDGLYDSCLASWQPVSSTANTNIAVIENRERLISANFSSSIEQLFNDVTIYGEPGTAQKSGTSNDSDSISSYNRRQRSEIDTTLATDYLCEAIATAIVDRAKDPIVSGTLTLVGNKLIEPGDLISVKIPSIEIDGEEIDGDYRVYRVNHGISGSGWTTSISVGEHVHDVAQYISKLFRMVRYNNFSMLKMSEELGSVSGDVSTVQNNLDTHTGASNPHSVTKNTIGLSNVTNDAQLKRTAEWIWYITSKSTPVTNDRVLIEDSAASYAKKQTRVADLAKGMSHSDLSGSGTNSHSTIDSHLSNTSNPHSVSKSDVGLGNVTNDAQVIKSIGTAKGNIIAYTASGTPANLAVGSNNQVLTADSSYSRGMKWATPEGVPSGTIVMWYGGSVPSGWYECNGSNGTPDLRGKFVVASGGTFSGTGGSASYTLTTSNLPSHRHVAGYSQASDVGVNRAVGVSGGVNYGTTYTGYAGESSPDAINTVPPYYALKFIMKG